MARDHPGEVLFSEGTDDQRRCLLEVDELGELPSENVIHQDLHSLFAKRTRFGGEGSKNAVSDGLGHGFGAGARG